LPPPDRTPVIRRTNSLFEALQRTSATGTARVAGRNPSTPGRVNYDPSRDPRTGLGAGPPRTWLDHPRAGFPNERARMAADEATEEAEQEAEDQRGRDERNRQRRRTQLAEELRTSAAQRFYLDGRLVQEVTLYDAEGNPVVVQFEGGFGQGSGFASPLAHLDTEGSGAGFDRPIGLTSAQRAQQEAMVAGRGATFSVLNLPDLGEGNQAFLMTVGPRTDAAGAPIPPGEQDLRAGGRNASQRTDAERGPSQNMMTLQNGVQWFRNLSRKDPEAYGEMVDLLVGAGYLSEEVARRSVYTRDAGSAFAYAAADAAENYQAGSRDDFYTFLQKSRGDAEGARGSGYQPVTRSFTDPTELAQTARTAAEDMLGRSLTDEETARFASHFRGLETAMYDQIDAAGRASGTATVVNPSSTGQAEAMLRAPEYNAERARQLTGEYMDSFTQLIFGGLG
jgi:hypothetical protein